MDQFDRAQKLEQEHREQAIAAQRHRPTETPDEDEDGTRYCLGCSVVISQERLDAMPTSVRCVLCESNKERQRG